MSGLSPAREIVTYLRLARQSGMNPAQLGSHQGEPATTDTTLVRPYVTAVKPRRPMPGTILLADGVGHRPASGFSDAVPACWEPGRTGIPWPEHGDTYRGPLCQHEACFGGAS